MKNLQLYFLFFVLIPGGLYAQSGIEWQTCLGGSMSDYGYSIQQTSDSGYIVAGWSNSTDFDVVGNHGGTDYWVAKLNSTGAIQWQKSLGGSMDDNVHCIRQTSDGGYIMVGESRSNDGDVTGNHGGNDFWLVKIDNIGTIEWEKSLGGSSHADYAWLVQQTTDGGYIVAGETGSNNGDVSGNHGAADYWIVKLNSLGSIQWQKTLGGSSTDRATSVQQTTDGGYIVAGTTGSDNGDVTAFHGAYDIWIVKLNSSGTIQWEKSFGGSSLDHAQSISQTQDGGYIIAGLTESNDGDVTVSYGEYDFWVVKLDSTGVLQWQKSLGGSLDDQAYFVQQTTDGGYIVAGTSRSNDGDLTGNHGNNDCWIVKLNNSGALQWQKNLGSSTWDVVNEIQQTFDGGYIFAGWAISNNGDVSGVHGASDFWIVKLSPTVSVSELENENLNIQTIPNPFSNNMKIRFDLRYTNMLSAKIFDFDGRLIKKLNTENLKPGTNEIIWDGTSTSGDNVKDGIYLISISSNNISMSAKVVLIRN